MKKTRLRIGILCGILAASLITYGLFFNKYDGSIPDWVYFGILIYDLFLLWYLYRQYRSKGDANTQD